MQKTNVIEQSSLQMFKLMTIDQLTIDDQPLMVKLMTIDDQEIHKRHETFH